MIRIACCVPFCRRMTDASKLQPWGASEWLCQEHWSGIPARRRKAYRRAVRRMDSRTPASVRLWRRIKAQAIEAAAGIEGGARVG
ncbi:hypothetical protein [Methylobacterium nodulans]|uniref:Uncharacterized protein n=1 Tax=Methylobacterium nodulans (strain LMG 21967 / CNCM I-2342 / ORS 2060) TaxID=460265 RepID=B8INZ4_METNO|nr:hypothetical protein [Methylobacterium nodulans]ACL58510.1 conserved hypothetical protein [Methylobacterium nodulans ORS 2060]